MGGGTLSKVGERSPELLLFLKILAIMISAISTIPNVDTGAQTALKVHQLPSPEMARCYVEVRISV